MQDDLIEQIARAVDAAVGYDIPRDDAVAAARAAHSVMAGKVAELEATNKRLVETLRPYLKQEEAIASARQQMRDQLAEERAALAPYPERRSE